MDVRRTYVDVRRTYVHTDGRMDIWDRLYWVDSVEKTT